MRSSSCDETEVKKTPTWSLRSELSHWSHQLATQTTLHTFILYKYSENRAVKTFLVLLGVAGVLAVPAYLIGEARSFFSHSAIQMSNSFKDDGPMEYPNITICNPLFFSKQRMMKFGIDDTTGSYLLYALNPNLEKQVRIWANNPNRSELLWATLDKAEMNLQRVLRQNDLTITELFHELAIRCEEFINLCEISDGSTETLQQEECCNAIFDQDNRFFAENAGTCYTTAPDKWRLAPQRAGRTHSIRMWAVVNTANAMKQSFFLLGDRVMERFSPVYALTLYPDSPPAAVANRPKKMSLGTISTVAIRKQAIDRSRLNKAVLLSDPGDECTTEEEEAAFEAQYGLEFSEDNCRVMLNHYAGTGNCTSAELLGIPHMTNLSDPSAPPLRPCLPSDTVALAKLITAGAEQNVEDLVFSNFGQDPADGSYICKKECRAEKIDESVTWGMGNFAPLEDMLVQMGVVNFISDEIHFVGIELFYESFEYSEIQLYREGIDVFLSRVGGWLGLAMGASMLSLLEVGIFIYALIRIICKVAQTKKK